MEQRKGNFIWGLLLIGMGIIFLIGNMSRIGMESLWPVFPLVVGLAFWVGYFHDRKNYGLLMPGSILVVVSLLFFYCNFMGWWHMEILWPVFILAPAVGFVAMYFGGPKDQGLLVPAGILSAVGLIFLFISTGFEDYWPLFLIVAGVVLILARGLPGKKTEG
jgi:hypothetical protein